MFKNIEPFAIIKINPLVRQNKQKGYFTFFLRYNLYNKVIFLLILSASKYKLLLNYLNFEFLKKMLKTINYLLSFLFRKFDLFLECGCEEENKEVKKECLKFPR